MSDDDDGDWAGFADGGFDLFADEAVQEFISPNRSQHPAGRATKLKRPPAGGYQWLTHGRHFLDHRLTESFGWTGFEHKEQHDVQELARILLNAITLALQGTPGAGLVSSLFEGVTVTQTTCVSCGVVSERVEMFSDLLVPVEGCSGLQQSLEQYTAAEKLSGDNKYWCDRCQAKVEASRFRYDWKRNQRTKIRSRFEFPVELDLGRFMVAKTDQAAPEATDSTQYTLSGVVIHRGEAGSGHYTALVRDLTGAATTTETASSDTIFQVQPGMSEATRWYTANDSTITSASEAELTASFSGDACAYMLFYTERLHASSVANSSTRLPPRWRDEIAHQNAALEVDRTTYDLAINRAELKLYFATELQYTGSYLVRRRTALGAQEYDSAMATNEEETAVAVEIDRRATRSELLALCANVQAASSPDQAICQPFDPFVHIMIRLPVADGSERAWYLGDRINPLPAATTFGDTENSSQAGSTENASIRIFDGIELLVWDGVAIGGIPVLGAPGANPIVVHLQVYTLQATVPTIADQNNSGELAHYSDAVAPGAHFDVIVPRTATVAALCQLAAAKLDKIQFTKPTTEQAGNSYPSEDLVVWRSATDPGSALSTESELYMALELSPASLEASASLLTKSAAEVVETAAAAAAATAVAHSSQGSGIITVMIAFPESGADFPVISVAVSVNTQKTRTIGELREAVGQQTCNLEQRSPKQRRLRLYSAQSQQFEYSSLLSDELSLTAAGVVDGSCIGVESGEAPKLDEIPLRVVVRAAIDNDPAAAPTISEVIVPASTTVKQCLELSHIAVQRQKPHAEKANGITPWHLCRTNWHGDKGAVLDDFDAVLAAVGVKRNDTLLLVPGEIVPKGYCKIQVCWRRPPYHDCLSQAEVSAELASTTAAGWVASAAKVVASPTLLAAVQDQTPYGRAAADELRVRRLADCFDAVNPIRTDDRISLLGTIIAPKATSAAELLDAIIEAPTLQRGSTALTTAVMAVAGAADLESDANLVCMDAIRRKSSGLEIWKVKQHQLDRPLWSSATKSGLAARFKLYHGMEICLEPITGDAASGNGPVVARKAGAVSVLLCRRDTARRSYRRSERCQLQGPWTLESLADQLGAATGLAPDRIWTAKYIAKSRTWLQLLPSPTPSVDQSGRTEATRSYLRPGVSLKSVVRPGDVFGVGDVEDGEDDMLTAADRAEELVKRWLAKQRREARLAKTGICSRRPETDGPERWHRRRRVEPELKIDLGGLAF